MSFFSELFGKSSAEKGLEKSNETLNKAWTISRNVYKPYLDQGTAGFKETGNLLGLNGAAARDAAAANFRTDPGYQFKMDQGIEAIDRSAAAKGLMGSGATLKALTEYGQGLADQGYSDYYNRLAAQGDTGANTANALVNTRVNTAVGVGQNQANIGATRTNQALGTVGAITGGLKTLAGAF